MGGPSPSFLCISEHCWFTLKFLAMVEKQNVSMRNTCSISIQLPQNLITPLQAPGPLGFYVVYLVIMLLSNQLLISFCTFHITREALCGEELWGKQAVSTYM